MDLLHDSKTYCVYCESGSPLDTLGERIQPAFPGFCTSPLETFARSAAIPPVSDLLGDVFELTGQINKLYCHGVPKKCPGSFAQLRVSWVFRMVDEVLESERIVKRPRRSPLEDIGSPRT